MKPSRIVIGVDYGPYREEEFIEISDFEELNTIHNTAAANYIYI